jgi:hypothetical protein
MLGFGKWKTEEWDGVVADKTEITQNLSDGDDFTTYYPHVAVGGAEPERKSYNKKLWDQYEVGDKIVKRAGEKKPVKG